jgi:hypothetical protein
MAMCALVRVTSVLEDPAVSIYRADYTVLTQNMAIRIFLLTFNVM